MLKDMKFHHLGLALKQDKDALNFLRTLGYDIGEKILDPLQNVYVRLCTSANQPNVEIVLPTGEGRSPIDGFLSKLPEMIYHTCYETDNLSQTLEDIEKAGLRCMCLSERKPAILFGGRQVSFYKIHGWGIIELLENT